ncbi:hypothetical protein GW17_00044385 [Ensete ventricosum]|uniref:Uncharacterized protein n=1 Tax=Ensete ventricosum TaxID=4639 RepID=A0A444D500_ENSVE|nr:hypothetical protein GW17_00044385 [Ensete ventricosum]RZR70540.1 hypothetical protein BHM03_00000392 [Ensete ventricosum]
MGKKRKSQDTHLDEADRTIYSVFRGAANSLSLIYTQAMAQQVLAFQAGERHALVFLLFRFLSRNFFCFRRIFSDRYGAEKLDQLILRHDEGSRVTVADILAYLQVLFAYSIGYGGEDTSMSPIPHLAHQYPQSSLQFRSTNIHNSSMVGTAAVGLARTGHCEETKNTVFSNALSSPALVRWIRQARCIPMNTTTALARAVLDDIAEYCCAESTYECTWMGKTPDRGW